MSDLNQLWLAPICHEEGDGRLWCEDDVWGDDCGCGIEQHSAVRYVLASDYDRDTQALKAESAGWKDQTVSALEAACAWREKSHSAESERDALRAQIEVMRELLRKVAPHFAEPPGLGYLHADIDAALQVEP